MCADRISGRRQPGIALEHHLSTVDLNEQAPTNYETPLYGLHIRIGSVCLLVPRTACWES